MEESIKIWSTKIPLNPRGGSMGDPSVRKEAELRLQQMLREFEIK
jgi:hypothetical protein